jgi:hypothetical protein
MFSSFIYIQMTSQLAGSAGGIIPHTENFRQSGLAESHLFSACFRLTEPG